MKTCELQGCTSSGAAKQSIGRYQVFDDTMGQKPVPTMSRPAELCQRCHDFAIKCGLTPRKG